MIAKTETTENNVIDINSVTEPEEAALESIGGDAHLSDMGNATRLAYLHGDRFHWCPALGWLFYDGKRWSPTDDVLVMQYARDVPRVLLEEAAAERLNAGRRKLLAEWALESEKASALSNMVRLLRSEPGIRVEQEYLDQDPLLLNLQNGTLDLRRGELMRHSPGDLVTKVANVYLDYEAKCPRWEKFLLEAMDGDTELVSYLQRWCGYLLTGRTSEQAFLFFSGDGGNGKGTFTETIAFLLGDYASPLSNTALTVRQGDASTNEWAALRGTRFAHCGEIDPGKTMDSALIKTLTGEDSISVRFLYREFFTLKPQFKIIYSANGEPRVRDNSYGFWRRIKHVPFRVKFDGSRKDARLKEKLKEEAEGILQWALAGLHEYLEHGMEEPEVVAAATREYRDEQSAVKLFVEDCTTRIQGYHLLLSELHQEYQLWARSNRERSLTNKRLRKELELMGYETMKGERGVRICDLALKKSATTENPSEDMG